MFLLGWGKWPDISVPPRSSPFMDLLGPPMKQRGGADAFALPLEHGTLRKLRVFQVFDGGEMLVDQGGVGERPEMLCGLQFWRIGRQKEQVHMVRHPQLEAGVPPRPIKHQHDLSGGASTTWCANSASSTSNTGILTVVARWKNVRPEPGCTKPTR